MYTKETENTPDNTWSVLDPEGDVIASGISDNQIDSLLSHLNR